MRRALSLLLAALLLLLGALCGAEDSGAVLTFSSFDGGGHEYTVLIGDPSILACDVTRDYGGADRGRETGSAYVLVCAFTGLAPGTTTVTVQGRSPILENDDALYTAVVDEALNVTLTPVRAISTFFLYRGGADDDTYSIARGDDGWLLSVNDGPEQPIDAASVAALAKVVEEYDLARWDGFDGSARVPDGEAFRLEIRLTDGAQILARGEGACPEDYFPAMDAMTEILEGAAIGGEAKEESDMILTIGGELVPVTWEDNASVAALKALLPLSIQMSMYGGFEQVGPIGQRIASDDAQTTTDAGDIVLYSSSQIVIFYGSNAWAYTRLGHVDLPREDMARLLGGGDVTITLAAE